MSRARGLLLAGFALAACRDPVAERAPAPPPPPPPSATEHAKLLAVATGLRERMCRCADQRCIDETNARYAQWLVMLSRGTTTSPLTVDETRQLGEIATSLAKCQAALVAAARPEADDPAVPPACLDYQHALEKLVTCRALPKSTRDGLALSAKSLGSAWLGVRTLQTAARKSVSDSCTMGLDALREVAKTFHCKP